MTDSYNVGDKLDPQSIGLITQLAPIGGAKKDKKSKDFDNFANLYDEGLLHFKSHDILIELNKSGDHCGHDIWIKSPPIPVKGIKYPSNFSIYRPIFDNADYKRLQSAYKSMADELLKEFWEPIVFPKTRDNNLSLYADRLNSMKKVKDKYSISETFNDYHTHDPSPNGVFGKLAEGAKTWVPAMEWFDDKLKSLTFDEIFSLLPPAERNIFKLWLGRVGVGRSRHIPINSDNPIIHTARMAIVLLSKQAGLTY